MYQTLAFQTLAKIMVHAESDPILSILNASVLLAGLEQLVIEVKYYTPAPTLDYFKTIVCYELLLSFITFQRWYVVIISKFLVLIMKSMYPWDSTQDNQINIMIELYMQKAQHICIGKQPIGDGL